MNIVDWIIIALFVLGAISGYRKGFIVGVIETASSIIGIVVAYIYHGIFSAWLDKTFGVGAIIREYLGDKLVLPESIANFRFEDLLKIDQDSAGAYLDTLHLDIRLKTELLGYLEKIRDSWSDMIHLPLQEVINEHLASILLGIFAFLVIWGGVSIALQIFGSIFRKIIHYTPLGILDNLGGVIISILLTGLSLTVVLGLITPLLDLSSLAGGEGLLGTILEALEESKYVPFFRETFSLLINKLIG